VIKDSNNRIDRIKVYYELYSILPTSSDWIGFYKKGFENNYYITYKYVDPRVPFVDFEGPREITEYDFRYHSGSQSKYSDVVRSSLFAVENTDRVLAEFDGGVIAVSWDIHSQEKTTSDWVALFKVGETNNKNYIQYKYVDNNSNATVFIAPVEKGQYEVRYFSYNLGKYVDFRKSNVVVI